MRQRMTKFIMGVKQKIYFVCFVKIQVDKVVASVTKGVKYMVIISSNTLSFMNIFILDNTSFGTLFWGQSILCLLYRRKMIVFYN